MGLVVFEVGFFFFLVGVVVGVWVAVVVDFFVFGVFLGGFGLVTGWGGGWGGRGGWRRVWFGTCYWFVIVIFFLFHKIEIEVVIVAHYWFMFCLFYIFFVGNIDFIFFLVVYARLVFNIFIKIYIMYYILKKKFQ